MPSPRGVLALLLAVLCLGNLAVTFRRSLIPLRLDGTISTMEVRREKHPGVDDVHLIWVNRRSYHVDAVIAAALREGDRITKGMWGRTLQTPRGTIHLTVSQDCRGMLVVMPLLGFIGGWVLRRPKNSS